LDCGNYQLALDLDRETLASGLEARVADGVDLFLKATKPSDGRT
jgi:hypothetical protein